MTELIRNEGNIGKWILHKTPIGDDEYIQYNQCSLCGEISMTYMDSCPYCKAKMQERDEV